MQKVSEHNLACCLREAYLSTVEIEFGLKRGYERFRPQGLVALKHQDSTPWPTDRFAIVSTCANILRGPAKSHGEK